MREIKEIHIHCSATRKIVNAETIRSWHKAEPRNWSDIGYHFVIRNDNNGTIERGRPIERQGAHVRSENVDSVGICYIGGVDKDLKAKDTMTICQEESFLKLVESLRLIFGENLPVYGHNDFTDRKECPSFKVSEKFPKLVV